MYFYEAKREHLCKNVIIWDLEFETLFVRYSYFNHSDNEFTAIANTYLVLNDNFTA